MFLPTTLTHWVQHEQASKPPPVRLMSLWAHKHIKIIIIFFCANYRSLCSFNHSGWHKFLDSRAKIPQVQTWAGVGALQPLCSTCTQQSFAFTLTAGEEGNLGHISFTTFLLGNFHSPKWTYRKVFESLFSSIAWLYQLNKTPELTVTFYKLLPLPGKPIEPNSHTET